MDKKPTCTSIFSIQVSGRRTQHTASKMGHTSLRALAHQAVLAICPSNLCQLTSRDASEHKHLLHSMGGGASRLIERQHPIALFPDATHAFHPVKEMALAATKEIRPPDVVVQQRS